MESSWQTYDLDFTIKPTARDFSYIKTWWKTKNPNVVQFSYDKNRMFVLRFQGNAVGYLIFRRNGFIATIDWAEVREDLQNNGLGGYMMKRTLGHFKRTRIKCVELWCVSDGSHRHAERLGFTTVKKDHDTRDWMMRPLVESREPCKEARRMFAIWNSWNTDGEPIYRWSLDGNEHRPIIAYCHYDWKVGIIEGGKITKSDSMKYYFPNARCDYIYIDNDDKL